MNLHELKFDTSYLNLDQEFYELTTPIPLKEPYLIHYNWDVARLLHWDEEIKNHSHLVSFFNSEPIFNNLKRFSMCYAGYQFGNYIPMLGDGRAHNLGKINGWNLQLKGSGETPFAKMADGRTTLASSIREYIMGEAMYHLGIPTTRALGIIGSNTNIIRSSIEKAAVVMRLSTSWIRFGTFEYFYYMKEYEKLKSLANYVIEESYPFLKNDDDKYYKMFCEVVQKSATLLAKWQAIGFCHGVLNTDNISIEGLTLDYGPFAMMDEFNYNYVCNKSDKAGRYAYGEQVNIFYWNLTKLSTALSPLIDKKRMEDKLKEFEEFIYFDKYIKQMRSKLGLEKKLIGDSKLIEELITTLHECGVDYTHFFRTLSRYNGDKTPLYEIAMEPIIVDNWLKQYDKRLEYEELSQEDREKQMLQTNPKYVLKNYMFDIAIKKAKQNDFSMIDTLIHIAKHPFDELIEFEHFTGDIPQEYEGLNLTCSS